MCVRRKYLLCLHVIIYFRVGYPNNCHEPFAVHGFPLSVNVTSLFVLFHTFHLFTLKNRKIFLFYMIITNELTVVAAAAAVVVVTSRSPTVARLVHRKEDVRLPFSVDRCECPPSSRRSHRFPASSYRTIVYNGRPSVRGRKTNEKASPKSECLSASS